MRPLAFIHIPKTAGTSFRAAAESCFGAGRCCFDYGPFAELTGELAREFMLDRVAPKQFREQFSQQGYAMFAGHVDASRYYPVFGIERMVSFVREPLQRIVAEYRHFQRYFGEQREFPDFYRDPRFINRQSRMLDGLHWAAMGFVGVTERYGESLELLNREFGISIPFSASNVSRDSLENDYPIAAPERAELISLNAEDIALYGQVCAQLDWRLKLQAAAKPHVRGVVKASDDRQLVGWALPPTPAPGEGGTTGAPAVVLDFLLNGDLLDTVSADKSCGALTRRGYQGETDCGFRLSLPEQPPGAVVECLVKETGQPLANSPLMVSGSMQVPRFPTQSRHHS